MSPSEDSVVGHDSPAGIPQLVEVRPPAILPADVLDGEAARLAVLQSYGVRVDEPDQLLDELVTLAAEICGTSMAAITVVGENKQWFKARIGLENCVLDRDDSFCAHALTRADPMVVPDALADPRFERNPLVIGAPWVRSYAGAPLVTPEGVALGALCVLDTERRVLTEFQLRQLRVLSRQVVAHLERQRQIDQLAAELAAERRHVVELEDTDRLLRGVLSHPGAVVYAKDLQGRYILGNESLHALLNAQPGSLMGRRDDEFLDSDTAAMVRDNDAEVARRGERMVLDERMHHPDGSVRQYLSTKFPLRDETGAIYAVAGVSSDVTVQAQAEARLRESERRWRLLFDESPVGIGLSDENGLLVEANNALCALFGRDRGGVIGRRGGDFVHPDSLPGDGSAQELLLDSGSDVVQVERRYLRPDGTSRSAWLTATHAPGPRGQRWMLVHAQDVTERLRAEQVLRDSEANLAAVAQVVAEIQAGSDARRTIVRACADLAHARFVCLFEPDPDDPSVLRVTSTNAPELTDFELSRDLPSAICRAFNIDSGPDADTPIVETARQSLPADLAQGGRVMVVPVRAADSTVAVLTLGFDDGVPHDEDNRSKVVRLLGNQAAVALRQSALLAELAQRAVSDPLTGLPNRRGWTEAIDRLRLERRPGQRMVVALLDFDRFKAYNDTYGHAAGDDLLRGFAEKARSVLRIGDVLARWGGEEFAVALPHLSADDADPVLQRLAAAVPGEETCSIGYTELGPDLDVAQGMIEADTALYVAKRTGRNRTHLFSPVPLQ